MKVVFIWEYMDAVDIVIQKKNVRIIVIMKTKICTSLEQSKKLIELGIDVNTADMHYSTWTILNEGEYILSPNQGETIEELQEDYGNQVIPAWSLSALLELIPSSVFLYSKLVKWDESYYIEHREVLYDNPIDAAFEMVCWLLENKKI